MTTPGQPILPFSAVERTLSNGLHVIAVNTGYPNLVSVQIPVQTGSRNEVEPGKSGFAHFFEHMMFRGTERFPATQYQEAMARMGARQNAYTTDDFTNYHATLAAEDLDELLMLEADRFMHLRYSEEDFKTESRAILGEYNKSSADPMMKLFEVQRDSAYRVHTYKHTTMGFLRDIEDMPNQFEYSLTFFDRWYRPEYTTVIVAGDIVPERTIEMVERHWGAWERGAYRVDIPSEPSPTAPVVAHVPWSSATLSWVTVGVHGPAFSTTSKDWAALDLTLDLVFGPTSEIYKRLVEREQVVDQLFAYLSAHQDPHLGTVMARLKDPKDASYVRDAILAGLSDAREKRIDDRKVEDGKSFGRYGFVRALDNSESIAATLAQYVRFERRFDTLNELYATYATLTSDDLLAAARKYIDTNRLVQTTLATEGVELGLRAPALPAAAKDDGPEVAPVVVQHSASPLVRFKALFNAGSVHDPVGKEGLAALAASMVTDAGSTSRRIDEITDLLFPIAGGLDVQVDKELTTFTGAIHRDNFERFVDIVLEQLTAPGLRPDDFERLKAIHLNALIQDLRASNDEELGKEHLQAQAFAGTRYAHPVIGTVSGIEAITLDDVRAFQERHYTRPNIQLAVAGDITEPQTKRLGRELGKLSGASAPSAPDVAARTPSGLEVAIIEKDTRATAISLGHPITVTRGDPDWVALWLARAAFGEHRASNGRLFGRIRELRGMNYGDYAYIEAFPRGMYQFFPDSTIARRAQLFEIWLRPFVPEQAVFGLKAALFELRRLIDEGLSPEEFERTREYLSKNVFVMTKTQDQQLGYALDSIWHGTAEFSSYVRNELRWLKVEEVNAALKRNLDADNLFVTCVTGDAEALQAGLLSTEPATITYDAPKPDDVLAEDQVIGAYDLRLTSERIRVVPVDEVFRG